VFPEGLTFPLSKLWSVEFPDEISYPIIANGRAFVVSAGIDGTYGNIVHAVNLADGTILWTRQVPNWTFRTNLTYGSETLFALTGDGKLLALDPATGESRWEVMVNTGWLMAAPPAYFDGLVYVGESSRLHAIRALNGVQQWVRPVAFGDGSGPTVSRWGAYVSYTCNHAYRFTPRTGALLWHHEGGCQGLGGHTAVLSDAGLLIRDDRGNLLLDKRTGTEIGTFQSGTPPATAGGRYFTLSGGLLEAHSLSDGSLDWSHQSDPKDPFISAPIIVNQAIFAGTVKGRIYAFNTASGKLHWHTDLNTDIGPPNESDSSRPARGFGAGEGVILFAASNRLFAFAGPAQHQQPAFPVNHP
jgi:outer membrane protein assembly factor BamB